MRAAVLLTIFGTFCAFGFAHLNHDDGRSFFSNYFGFSDPVQSYGTDSSYWFYPAVEKQNSKTVNFTKNGTKSGSKFVEHEIGRIYGRNYARLISFLPEFVQDLLTFILDNPFVGVVGLGSLIALIKQYFWKFYNKVHYEYTTTLEVSSDQQTYQWLENWLNARNWGNCQHVTGIVAKTSSVGHDEDCDCDLCDGEEGPGGAPNFQLIPNLSHYGFEFKGQWIDIGKDKEKEKEQGEKYAMGHNRSLFAKTLTLTTKGKDPAIFHDLLAECRQFFIQQTKVGTCVWTTRHGGWCSTGQRRKRPLESVVLGEGVLEELLADIKRFIASSKWYIDRGIPYRRGYLLYGPPGCGKTSIISAIAGYLDYGVSILSLSDSFMNDDNLRNLINSVPQRSILLLEDIDAAFESRAKGYGRGHHDNSVSFSGLLNAIDGVASADARILFMTTNYVDRLDSALIRPGRVDLRKKVDYCSEYQVRKLFKRFYPHLEEAEADSLAEEFVKKLRLQAAEGKDLVEMTPAQLQGYLLIYRDDAKEAVENIGTLFGDLEEEKKKRLKKEHEEERDDAPEESSEEEEEKEKKKKKKRNATKRSQQNQRGGRGGFFRGRGGSHY